MEGFVLDRESETQRFCPSVMRTRRRRVTALRYSTPTGPERGLVGGGSEEGPEELNHTTRFLPQSDRAGEASLVSAAVFQRAQKKDEASASAETDQSAARAHATGARLISERL